MWAGVSVLIITCTNIRDTCDHVDCDATLNQGTDEGSQALSQEDHSWRDMQIVSKLHIGHKPVVIHVSKTSLAGTVIRTASDSLDPLRKADITVKFEDHVRNWLSQECVATNKFSNQV